jgi:hypothetical protein
VVENPHRIYPAERLIIPPLPGEMTPTPETPVVTPAMDQGRTRFWVNRDTVPSLSGSRPAVLYRVQPKEFHAAPWLADSSQLAVMGFVFKSVEQRNERDKLSTKFHPYDQVHVAYVGTRRARVGDLLLVVALGRTVEGFGRVVEPTGVIRIDSLGPNTMMGMVTHQFGVLTTGDLLVPMDTFPGNLTRRTVPVSEGPEGEIVEFLTPQPLYSTQEVGFVSLGSSAGVQVGDEITAWLPTRRHDRNRYETLPPQEVARLLVMRVTERSATVRVTSLQQPALRSGLPVRITARMP